jgi:hypothetical protein
VSPLLAQEFPNTAGFPYLSLAVSLLQQPAVARLLVAHDDFCPVLEGLLARKSPSPKDLQVRWGLRCCHMLMAACVTIVDDGSW